MIDISAKFTRIDATIRRSRRRRHLTVRTIRLRESKNQRVWRLQEITEQPATPDLRDFQRYLSKEGKTVLSRGPGVASSSRETFDDSRRLRRSDVRLLRHPRYPRRIARHRLSRLLILLRDNLRRLWPVLFRPVSFDKRDDSSAATYCCDSCRVSSQLFIIYVCPYNRNLRVNEITKRKGTGVN